MTSSILLFGTARNRANTPRAMLVLLFPLFLTPGCALFTGYEYTQPDGTVVVYKSPAEVGAKAAVDHLSKHPPAGVGLWELFGAVGFAVAAGAGSAIRQHQKINQIKKTVEKANGGAS